MDSQSPDAPEETEAAPADKPVETSKSLAEVADSIQQELKKFEQIADMLQKAPANAAIPHAWRE